MTGNIKVESCAIDAERGPDALSEAKVDISTGKYGSDFVEYVANKLRDAGWIVQTQVGSSGYRIDLAVVDPDNPLHYLLGIECDGPVYRDASTARDRDKLRQLVLGYLGWSMERIWSADWYWPKRELTNAMTAVIQDNFSVEEAELYRLTARVFGWQQASSKMTENTSMALECLIEKGYAEKRDNLIVSLL